MDIPSTLADLIERIARETARMSYPGSMSRGNKPVVRKGTKALLEEHFAKEFPLREVWSSAPKLARTYDDWHYSRSVEISKALGKSVSRYNNPIAVAAKFLNTFMHQLMKYEPCRALWPVLHLPLDARVFTALSRLHSKSLAPVEPLFTDSPYKLPYEAHQDIQAALWLLVRELNARPRAEFEISARIELNWLWV